jgi:hypothetical protein
MSDPLQNGLRRHEQIVNELRYFSVDKERIVKVSRMIDELVAAVTVQHLEMKPEEQKEMARQIRDHYEPRWKENP